MSNLSMFFQGNKNFITRNDLKEFFNIEVIKSSKENIYEDSNTPVEFVTSTIRNLNGEVLENVYILKSIHNHEHIGSFLCIVDEINKFIIINEKILLDKINFDKVDLNEEHLRILKTILFDYNKFISISKYELKYLNEEILVNGIGKFKVISAITIFNELKNEVDKVVFKTVDKVIEKFHNKDEFKKLIEYEAKSFFIKQSNFKDKLNSSEYRISYLDMYKDAIRYYTNTIYNYIENTLYNYTVDRELFIKSINEYVIKLIEESDNIILFEKYFDCEMLYVFKHSVLLFDTNRNIYKDDSILLKMREIYKILDSNMKTLVINGEKRKNDMIINFENESIEFPDIKNNKKIRYNINDKLEIKYGKKTLISY